MTATAALTVSGLTVVFGASTALDNVSLELCSGEVHALIGPNGAGKTTLVNAVTGVVGVRSGTVVVGGTNVTGWSSARLARHGVTRTFQHPQLFATLTPRQHLDVVRTRPASGAADVWSALADELVSGMADVPARRLAFGDQRLLELARVVALAPAVVFVDEPVSGLDRAERDRMKANLRAVASHAAVCLIEHDMRVVQDLAAAVTVLDQGAVIASGPPSVLASDERVRAAYLGGGNVAAG